MKKKLLVLMLAFAMALAFAACGGGGGGSEAEPEPEAAAEPNAGIGGVVFVMPDGWTVTGASLDGYLQVTIPDSDYMLYGNIFGEDDLESVNEWNPERGADTVEAYYEKTYTSEDALSRENLENTAVKVCDTDAQYNKYKAESGEYLEAATAWLYDGEIYSIGLFNPNSYGENGEVVEDVTKLTDDELSTYEGLVASIQPGDGEALMKASMSADSIGSFAFEAPAGYDITAVYNDERVTYSKPGSEIVLEISRTGEEDFKNITDENGNHPESLQAWYERFLSEGMEETTIADCRGHIDKWPYEDGNYYNCSAEYLADDGIYSVFMGTNAWGEEGNIKEGAETLTDDDLALFDAFMESLKKK